MENATLHPINQLNHRNVAISVLCLCERKDSFLYLFHVPGVAFSSSFYLIPPNHFTNKPDKWHGQCRAITSETLAYDLNNEWTAALSLSLYLFGRFVRKNSYTKDMFWVSLFCFVSFKCVAVAVAIAVVASVSHSQRDECAFFSVLLLVFGIVFTFNAHRSSIRDHFSCYWIFFVYIIRSSLSYSFTLALSLCFNAPAIQPLFICFTLFVYLYLCT